MSDLSRGAIEVFALLGCYTGYFGSTQFNEHVWNSLSYLCIIQTIDVLFFFKYLYNVSFIILYNDQPMRGPGSSVGIATAYGLDGPGIESRWGEIFRTCPDRPWSPTSVLYNGYRFFPGGKGSQGMTTTNPHLVPKSWKSIARAFFLGGCRGTRTPKHFVNLTGESKNFKVWNSL